MSPEAPATPEVVITDRAGAPADGTMIRTAIGEPDVKVVLMGTIAQVLVRGARTYLQAFVSSLGLLTIGRPVAESIGVMIAPTDLAGVVIGAAGLALFPTLVAVAQNTVELLGHVDSILPKFRA